MYKPLSSKINFPELEKKILKMWYEKGIIDKYLRKNQKSKLNFSFLDGPITANNPMGIHHGWGRTYKDLWQRFFNMRGYNQRFQNGFDCQGLWVEVEVEKELGIKMKKDIENIIPGDKKASIAEFVNRCKKRVIKYAAIQTEQSKRLGYFMDWENSYYTMSDENNYMIWFFLKTCHKNGWIYKGRDSVPWCPRCETAISQHEMLTEDYKELTHETVFLKLKITNQNENNLYLLVWTTTPWTIPANVSVGVNTEFTYAIWENKIDGEKIIFLDKDENGNIPKRTLKDKEISLVDFIFNGIKDSFVKIKQVSGKELLGIRYEAPFDDLPLVKKAKKDKPETFHTVVDASKIVVSTEGTGLLHVAPGAGKEDFDLGKKENLSVISVINDDATYLEGLGELSGKNAKKQPKLIIDYLKNFKSGKHLFKTMFFTHRYPACWRCKTELVWKIADEWYISMDKSSSIDKKNNLTLRERMIEVAKKIKWIPDFGLERELDWLNNMHDWLISKKNRYWGLALPIYECNNCGWFDVIGSKEELKTRAVKGWENFAGNSPHKPWIDEVKIKCDKCHREISRINDVGNPWLDAGIVSFSTLIDPKTKQVSYTSDKKYWKRWFPADFITESFPGQFKNWFYSLIAMSTVLENTNPFKKVLGFATLLGEDGRPMHKSWGNAIEFNEAADKIGVDVMRWMYVIQNPSDNLLFGYKKADETRRKFHLMLWNVYNFFVTYANVDKYDASKNKDAKKNLLDNWILSKLYRVISLVTEKLEIYDAQSASLAIQKFIDDLSTWYIRRCRDRVGPTVENTNDKIAFYNTLYKVLVELAKLLAPFIPFISEEIYTNLTDELSVHLASWPRVDRRLIDKDLEIKMDKVREIVELGHAERKIKKIKVRQPLASLKIKNLNLKLTEDFIKLIRDELNIKKVEMIKGKGKLTVELDTFLSSRLKAEGEARELVRKIQLARKEIGCKITDEVLVYLPNWPLEFTDYIKKETLAKEITKKDEFLVEKI
uniref:Isoleucine--tRNA ligase n=1 Tax=candidate division CPR3 bacterium TaxID=2268181 RepID=A0A7C4M5Q3_UNCC3